MPNATSSVRTKAHVTTTNASHSNKSKINHATASVRTIGGVTSSHISSAKPKQVEKIKNLPRIIDDLGNDVTPKPLFDSDPAKQRHVSSLFHSLEGNSTPTDLLSTGSVLGTNIMLTGGQSYAAIPDNATHMSSDSIQQQTESINESGSVDNTKDGSALFLSTIERPKPLDALEKIHIKETNTFMLFDMPASCISSKDPIIDTIKAKNNKYLDLCKSKAGNDSFVERGMNTFNDAPKIKTTQTDRITISEKAVNATTWDLYDSYNKKGPDETLNVGDVTSKTLDTSSRPLSVGDASVSKISNSYKATNLTTISGNGSSIINSSYVEREEIEREAPVLVDYHKSESFNLNAFFMERLINQNTYQAKQAKYRGMQPLAEPTPHRHHDPRAPQPQYEGTTLERLWTYTSPLTANRNVTCIAWNHVNQDVLAAGYGKFEYNNETNGLVCCWCLKNPEHPERSYKTDAGVTSLAFSQKHANLLAVGLFNGTILVFDVRSNSQVPLLSTSETDNKHLSPVWQLEWTDHDRTNNGDSEEEMEILMSISADGRVTQWMIRKGFESTDYLKLKRVIDNKQMHHKKDSKTDKDKSEGLISRNAGGLCFDIWKPDKTIYICGTEEGYIHKCSISYNEQYLFTYQGHTGPIYKLTWSPFLKNVFISSSGDWSVRLWKADRAEPCMFFNSSTKAVYDICWSHQSATVFCCVNESSIELWDLSKNILDPIYVTTPMPPIKLNTVSYVPNANCIIVGTNEGSLWVYSMKNLPPPTNADVLEEIMRQSLLSQLEIVKDEDETKEAIERHQAQYSELHRQQMQLEEQTEKDRNYFDALENKIDKVKKDTEQAAKKIHSQKSKTAEQSAKKQLSINNDNGNATTATVATAATNNTVNTNVSNDIAEEEPSKQKSTISENED